MCLVSIRYYDNRYIAIPNFASSGSLYPGFTVVVVEGGEDGGLIDGSEGG